ncbi:hypothetical protein JQM68_02720 [Oscillibacter valericigenes]|uniref:hypothetical protein n=1 Tax=Oscillibacter valericigenes TaxID=351091 RepID=UPI001F1B0C6D|nr:hypothetical protein [Oscillibacter valericigenes]MCF2616106.1 hypothetical protein [Oscillibacter valericigenes]
MGGHFFLIRFPYFSTAAVKINGREPESYPAFQTKKEHPAGVLFGGEGGIRILNDAKNAVKYG